MQRSDSLWKSWVVALFLLVGTGLLYRPLLQQQFLTWDDQVNVYHNPYYQPASLHNTAFFWNHIYNKTYRPLIHTVWALLAWQATVPPRPLPGSGSTIFDAGVFKAANLFFHLLNVWLVWMLIRQLGIRSLFAGVGALFFAVHPLQVEAVAWVTGLNETVCASFCFGALWLYIYSRSAKSPLAFYGAATFCYLLALLCKPAAVALPLVAAILDVFWMQRRDEKNQGKAIELKTLRPLALWLVIAVLWTVVTRLAHPPEDLAQLPSWPTRFLVAGDAWTFYFWKILWPYPLGIDYGRSPSTIFDSFWVYLTWLVPCGLVWASWKFRQQYPLIGLVILMVMAWTLPVAGFSPYRFQLLYSTVADRYLYVAMLGPALAVAWFAQRLSKPRFWLLSPLFVIYGWLTAQQLQTWNNNFTFFSHTLQVNPRSFMAAANLGNAYKDAGELSKSADSFQHALSIQPHQNEVVALLAGVLTDQERFNEAIPLWQEHLRQTPDDSVAWDNLGTSLIQVRRLSQARDVLRHAVQLAPHSTQMRCNLAVALWELKDMKGANEQLREALRLEPDNTTAKGMLAEINGSH